MSSGGNKPEKQAPQTKKLDLAPKKVDEPKDKDPQPQQTQKQSNLSKQNSELSVGGGRNSNADIQKIKQDNNDNDQEDEGQPEQGEQEQKKFQMPPMPKFQALPLREYYDQNLSACLLEGLKTMGRTRPANPIRYLGEFLLQNDPEARSSSIEKNRKEEDSSREGKRK